MTLVGDRGRIESLCGEFGLDAGLFAIVLDDEVISAPRIREPILGGSGIISGNFTVQSANERGALADEHQ